MTEYSLGKLIVYTESFLMLYFNKTSYCGSHINPYVMCL